MADGPNDPAKSVGGAGAASGDREADSPRADLDLTRAQQRATVAVAPATGAGRTGGAGGLSAGLGPMRARKHTFVGLAPPPATSGDIAAKPDPSAGLNLAVPGSVRIRTVDDDELDETMVRKPPPEVAPEEPATTKSVSPLAMLPNMAGELGPDDESTASAQRPGLGDLALPPLLDDTSQGGTATERVTAPIRVTAPVVPSLDTQGGTLVLREPPVKLPPDEPSSSEDFGESTIPKAKSFSGEDSITSSRNDIPLVKHGTPLSEAEDITDANGVARLTDSLVDVEESITAQAPGHLTNMLRVIASGSNADVDASDVPVAAESPPEPLPLPPFGQETAVMLHAPVRPPDAHASSSRRAAAAPIPTPMGSESALRIHRPSDLGGDRGSLNLLVESAAIPENAPIEPTALERALLPAYGGDAPQARAPRYGLLVIVVALVSLAVPAILFLVLSQSSADLPARTTTTPESDLTPRIDMARGKKPVPSATPVVTVTAPPKKPPPPAPGPKRR